MTTVLGADSNEQVAVLAQSKDQCIIEGIKVMTTLIFSQNLTDKACEVSEQVS